MTRKITGRQRDRAENIRRSWAAKLGAAGTPRQLASVQFDQVRADIDRMPERRADAEWTKLADALAAIHRRLEKATQREIHDSHSRAEVG